jgi:hypothetical protein
MKNNSFSIKVVRNKRNGQINLAIPKKKLSKNLLKDFNKVKKLKIKVEGWE